MSCHCIVSTILQLVLTFSLPFHLNAARLLLRSPYKYRRIKWQALYLFVSEVATEIST